MSKNRIIVAVLVAVVLAVPAVTMAEFKSSGTILKSVGLKFSIDGKSSGKVVVQKGKDFKVSWEASGVDLRGAPSNVGIGCKNNWGGSTSANGTDEDSVSSNRAFVITCSGLGASRSAAIAVEVGTIDLTVPSLSVTGLNRKSVTSNGKTISGYAAGPYILKSSVRNLGKLPAGPFSVQFKYGTEVTKTGNVTVIKNASLLNSVNVTGLNGMATKNADLSWTSAAGPKPLYFQACVDEANAINESNSAEAWKDTAEKNNCSKVVGPYLLLPN